MKQIRLKKIHILCISLIISVAILGSGCASIVHGGSRTVSVNTDPSGAHVVITKTNTGEAVHSGTTPLTVSLEPKGGYFKGQSYTVRFELAGYRSDEVILRSELSGWYFGNIIFGGLIGMLIVDPATGSMWNLSPDQLDRTLSADQAELLQSGDGFILALIADTTESERNKMVKVN